MRGNSDRSETYPFSVAPAAGWGNPNPSGEYVVADSSVLGKAVKINSDGSFDRVEYADATRFSNPADAAIASGRVATRFNRELKQAA